MPADPPWINSEFIPQTNVSLKYLQQQELAVLTAQSNVSLAYNWNTYTERGSSYRKFDDGPPDYQANMGEFRGYVHYDHLRIFDPSSNEVNYATEGAGSSCSWPTASGNIEVFDDGDWGMTENSSAIAYTKLELSRKSRTYIGFNLRNYGDSNGDPTIWGNTSSHQPTPAISLSATDPRHFRTNNRYNRVEEVAGRWSWYKVYTQFEGYLHGGRYSFTNIGNTGTWQNEHVIRDSSSGNGYSSSSSGWVNLTDERFHHSTAVNNQANFMRSNYNIDTHMTECRVGSRVKNNGVSQTHGTHMWLPSNQNANMTFMLRYRIIDTSYDPNGDGAGAYYIFLYARKYRVSNANPKWEARCKD